MEAVRVLLTELDFEVILVPEIFNENQGASFVTNRFVIRSCVTSPWTFLAAHSKKKKSLTSSKEERGEDLEIKLNQGWNLEEEERRTKKWLRIKCGIIDFILLILN